MSKIKSDSWSNIETNDKGFIGRKRIDYSGFTKGTTIPQRYHQGFLNNLSKKLNKGMQVKVELLLDDKKYKATVRWPNSKARNGVTIQLLYSNKLLLDLLRNRLEISYDYIMNYIDETGKKPSKIPEEYSEYIEFYKGDSIDTFNIKLVSKSDEDTYGNNDDDIENIDESNKDEEILKCENIVEAINRINSYISSQGFTYDAKLIKNFYLSLKTKPFVILSGISGTGKSKLVELFANSIGATTENERFKLVPIKPDWSDSTDLLGYRNIESKFTPGIITRVAYEAMKNPSLSYFICLDEMNLARVEYYFSDVLSLMETRRKNEDGEIITNNLLSKEQIGRDANAETSYGDVYLPENLYIIGTVNMDETTFPFSKKVLDRANTIEFNTIDLNYNFDNENLNINGEKNLITIYNNDFLKSDFLKISECKEYKNIVDKVIQQLISINKILEQHNAHFGYRVRDEIIFYMIYATNEDLMSFDEAFDLAVLQKILPKISGSSSEILEILIKLFELFNKVKFPSKEYLEEEDIRLMETKGSSNYGNTNKKIIYMIRRFNRDGFTTFWQ